MLCCALGIYACFAKIHADGLRVADVLPSLLAIILAAFSLFIIWRVDAAQGVILLLFAAAMNAYFATQLIGRRRR